MVSDTSSLVVWVALAETSPLMRLGFFASTFTNTLLPTASVPNPVSGSPLPHAVGIVAVYATPFAPTVSATVSPAAAAST